MSGLQTIGVQQHVQKEAEAVYVQLSALLAAMPNLRAVDDDLAIPDATLRWLGECAAVISRLKSTLDDAELNLATNSFVSSKGANVHAQKIKMVLYRALALAQQRAPATAQSAFVATGADFDAFAAMHRIFEEATLSVLVVDPYMDESALLSFAVMAKEGVGIGLLADEKGVRPALEPAAKAWIDQYGGARPLKVRIAPARTLHDRLILVDREKAWILTQSLKDFAARSPATIQRVDSGLAAMKFEAYAQIWNASTVIAETP